MPFQPPVQSEAYCFLSTRPVSIILLYSESALCALLEDQVSYPDLELYQETRSSLFVDHHNVLHFENVFIPS